MACAWFYASFFYDHNDHTWVAKYLGQKYRHPRIRTPALQSIDKLKLRSVGPGMYTVARVCARQHLSALERVTRIANALQVGELRSAHVARRRDDR